MITELIKALKAIEDEELERAIEKHGEFSSRHEGWAKILEEAEEASEEMLTVMRLTNELKSGVFHDRFTKEIEHDILYDLHYTALCGAAELIQTAAMATKFLRLYNE